MLLLLLNLITALLCFIVCLLCIITLAECKIFQLALFLVRKSTHITHHLMNLHWLHVLFRLIFKILLHVFKVVNGVSPSYLDDVIRKHRPSRSLRSSNANLRSVPRTINKSGDCRLSVCGPLL